MRKILTLAIIHKGNKVLLGLKKRGFGMGRWNGFGGKVEENETIEAAAKRELREEAGVLAKDLERRGIIEFEFAGNSFDATLSSAKASASRQDKLETLEVHIFYCSDIEGEPQESEEMRPQWFDIREIPFSEMWADDQHWLPMALAGKRFRGKFLFDGEKSNKIITYSLEEVEAFVEGGMEGMRRAIAKGGESFDPSEPKK
ncbi:MAG: 8-oxo-dGTP diphosphatase [Candidatus Spechtbacteria bacterium]|nr:8-oxo-dGTP diphosphatase [Candidatus Spechtbacteria bacterium]